MSRLLILGAGQMQVPIITMAKKLGHTVIVADFDKNAPGFKYADIISTISTIDKDAVLKLAIAQQVDGILTTSDYPVRVVAFVAEHLGLPSMSQRVAKLCTNKYEQRLVFREKNVNTPFFMLCDANSDLSSLDSFPYIVKPVDSSASRGVKCVENNNQLYKAVNEACLLSRSGKAIVESYIGGNEYSVETLTQNGVTNIIQITEKITRGRVNGYFVEDCHIEPARISQDEARIICEEVMNGINALGVDNCPTHTEIKLWDGKPYIIEMACRLGGDYITSDLVPLSTGISMLENLIHLSLGEEINVESTIHKYSCVQFLNEENYYKCCEFIDSKDCHIYRSEVMDYSSKVIKDSLSRLGYIIMQTDTESEIRELLNSLI